MGDEIKSKDLGMRAQKKILGKMANKNLTKRLIDEKTYDVLDEFYKVQKARTNKKEAEKLLNNVIKIMVKIAILHRNDQFTSEELKLADKLQQKIKMTSMTIVSFYEVDFTFDKYVLSTQINEGRVIMQQLVEKHVTEKTQNRINSVFDILGDTELLEALFESGGPHTNSLKTIATRINELIDEGVI